MFLSRNYFPELDSRCYLVNFSTCCIQFMTCLAPILTFTRGLPAPNATTDHGQEPKLNNHHGVKTQFRSPGDYKGWLLVPCKLLLRLPLQFQPLHFNDCCNEAAMNEFDNSPSAGRKQQPKILFWVLGDIFLVAFILYPMIIPGSISVIRLDMMWDPDADSQSLSMSGFSYMLQRESYQD